MNHKKRKPKNSRAGCLMCKPWKMNGAKGHQCSTSNARNEEIAKDTLKRYINGNDA